MKRYQTTRTRPGAFTIIELLVVVSIIALLVGILLPAIGKARDQAQLTRSNANVKQLSTAGATYAAEWSDRQFTAVNDNLSHYGNNLGSVFQGFEQQTGSNHPWMWVGYGNNGGAGVVYGFAPPPEGGSTGIFLPIQLDPGAGQGFGAFRMVNARAFNTYLNGRFYDPVFYAPKDTQVWNSVEPYFDNPNEFVNIGAGQHKWSSYCFSPAAMYAPLVFGKNPSTNKYYNSPWNMQGGFRSPGYSSAQYSDLKTHIIEHNWLQNRKKPCNPNFTGGPYDNCTPYYFNHAFNSQPVCAFFDGHIETVGQEEAMEADTRVATQTNPSHGLWSRDTPLAADGYFIGDGQDWTATSFHILTIDGIKGRDMVAK
jgi:type II secretory pathway pseudopilin PulG